MSDVKFSDPAIQGSVVTTPPASQRVLPSAHPYVMFVATAAQSVTPWGVSFKQRDKELRSFWISEPWLASVVYSVSIRNASFAWDVVGSDPSKPRPKNTIARVKQILKNSDRGNGWKSLLSKTCIALYTQDNAAFWEIIRSADNPSAPVINIAHLDSARCQRTGDPTYPIIYTDLTGKERVLSSAQLGGISFALRGSLRGAVLCGVSLFAGGGDHSEHLGLQTGEGRRHLYQSHRCGVGFDPAEY
jgi:hypothetical protein